MSTASGTVAAGRERLAGALLWTLVVASCTAGCIILAAGLASRPEGLDWLFLGALCALAVSAERTDFTMYGDSRLSLAFIPIFAAFSAYGLTGLAILVPVTVAASAWGRPFHKTAFNFGALMIAGAASVAVLNAFAGIPALDGWPEDLIPAAIAGAANFAANSVLVACAIALASRSSLRSTWTDNFLWLLPHYVILALIGESIVAANAAMGLAGVAVFLAPPLMMRLSIKQYVDRTSRSTIELRQAHGQLQQAHDQLTAAVASLGNAYDGTLRSLVAALDARDSDTAGHSERVADMTQAIATEMGIDPESDQWRYIVWGALLHDVGKIAIPDEILRKPGGLAPDEWEAMRAHPSIGFEILQSVDFLRPAGEIVLAHHEKFDGSGYPHGLAGDDIPIGARIFMIADAFDAMTSDRTYRSAMAPEEALAEILRHSGTQFDPAAVRAFLSVYQKRFVGTVHHRSFVHSALAGGTHRELSDSLRKAIAEAAGLED